MDSSSQCDCAICMVELCGTSGHGCSNKHAFHVVCILEWLKRDRSCPLCREHIKCVTVNDAACGRSEIPLSPTPPRSPAANDGVEHMLCEVCNGGDDEASLLLCDICDGCYHMRCLDPPLASVPEGYWYCPTCEQELSSQRQRLAQQDSQRMRRQITRTALSQNVRRSLRTIVDPDGAETEESDDESETEDEDESADEDVEAEETAQFENDEDQDEFVLHALDQPGPSNRPVPSIPTRRRRVAKKRKRSRRTTVRGKPRRKKRRTKSRRTTSRRSIRSRGGYGAVYKRLAQATNVNLKKSTCYNVAAVTDRSRGRVEPIGGTLNLFQAGEDEYVSDSDSDDFELSSGARQFDRPLLQPPRKPSPPVQEARTATSASVGLLDEILDNQTRTLAPSNLLKIKRDGTLEERSEMKEYRKAIQERLCSHPAFQANSASTTTTNTISSSFSTNILSAPVTEKGPEHNMSFQNDNPSTSVGTSTMVSNGGSPKKSRWGPVESRTPTHRNNVNGNTNSPLVTTRLSLPPRPPVYSAQLQRNSSLLPMQPFLTTVSLADVVNPPPPPPPVLQQGNSGNNMFALQHQFMSHMFSPLLPSNAATTGIDPALLGMLSGATAPGAPFNVGNLSSIPMPVAPPPPPPTLPQSAPAVKSTPTRNNDDSLTEMDISPQTSGKEKESKKENGHSEEPDKVRLRTDADREMKKALTPYFRNKKITKEEYKSLMKRGVYKLVKRGKTVTSEAATKLAMNYVFEMTDHR